MVTLTTCTQREQLGVRTIVWEAIKNVIICDQSTQDRASQRLSKIIRITRGDNRTGTAKLLADGTYTYM